MYYTEGKDEHLKDLISSQKKSNIDTQTKTIYLQMECSYYLNQILSSPEQVRLVSAYSTFFSTLTLYCKRCKTIHKNCMPIWCMTFCP